MLIIIGVDDTVTIFLSRNIYFFNKLEDLFM